MKKIILPLLVIMIAVSCKRQSGETFATGDAVVEMNFNTIKTYAPDPEGTTSENNIAQLDILVFKGDAFMFRREAYRSGSNFRTTVPVDAGYTFHFIANSTELIDAKAAEFLIVGNTWEQVRAGLIDRADNKLSTRLNKLPMWGMLENLEMKEGIINYVKVLMLRSVVSVDVNVNLDATEFSLTSVSLIRQPNIGFVAPKRANVEYDNVDINLATKVQALTPEAPEAMVNNTDEKFLPEIATPQSVFNKMYCFENPTTSGTVTATRRFTRVVVGGDFAQSGTTTYYPIDISVKNNVINPTLRNWKYYLNILSVHGPGYETEEEAADGFPVNIEYEVLPWEMDGESEIIIDGPFHLSLNKNVFLGRATGSSKDVPVETNIKIEDMTFTFLGTQNGSQTNNPDGTIENDRFKMEVITDIVGGKTLTWFKFTTLQDYSTTDLTLNKQKLLVTSGRIKFEISLTQTNNSAWELGGYEDDIEIGKP